MCFERNPHFLDRSKAITGLDGLSEFFSIVDNVIGLGNYMKV